jgi:hypothetical protein
LQTQPPFGSKPKDGCVIIKAELFQQSSTESMLLLLAAPEAMRYYPHIGFKK